MSFHLAYLKELVQSHCWCALFISGIKHSNDGVYLEHKLVETRMIFVRNAQVEFNYVNTTFYNFCNEKWYSGIKILKNSSSKDTVCGPKCLF